MRDIFSQPSDNFALGGRNESVELLKAWAGTSLAFAVAITGPGNLLSGRFVTNLVIAMVVAGIGFLLHELAHRVVARSYGAEAHFVANDSWLLISLCSPSPASSSLRQEPSGTVAISPRGKAV